MAPPRQRRQHMMARGRGNEEEEEFPPAGITHQQRQEDDDQHIPTQDDSNNFPAGEPAAPQQPEASLYPHPSLDSPRLPQHQLEHYHWLQEQYEQQQQEQHQLRLQLHQQEQLQQQREENIHRAYQHQLLMQENFFSPAAEAPEIKDEGGVGEEGVEGEEGEEGEGGAGEEVGKAKAPRFPFRRGPRRAPLGQRTRESDFGHFLEERREFQRRIAENQNRHNKVGDRNARFYMRLVSANGVVSPSTLPPGQYPRPPPSIHQNSGGNLRCPICGASFLTKHQVQSHFLACIKANGNPHGARWDDLF